MLQQRVMSSPTHLIGCEIKLLWSLLGNIYNTLHFHLSLSLQPGCADTCLGWWIKWMAASEVVTSAESTLTLYWRQIWLFWKSTQRKRSGSNTEQRCKESWETTLRDGQSAGPSHHPNVEYYYYSTDEETQETFMVVSMIHSMLRECE